MRRTLGYENAFGSEAVSNDSGDHGGEEQSRPLRVGALEDQRYREDMDGWAVDGGVFAAGYVALRVAYLAVITGLLVAMWRILRRR